MKRFFKILLWLAVLLFVVLPIGGGIIYLISSSDIFAEANRIGVIWIKDTIRNPLKYLDGLKTFRDDDKVKAILIRIDSPGGGVSASQEIYKEIIRTKTVKPVIASLGGIATSGGYYVACAADKIIASPGTVTGSIGVIAFFPNLEELFKKIGYKTIVIKSGKFKDIGNPDRAMTSEEEALLKDAVMEIHKQFVRDIANARGLDEKKISSIADGRIITGEHALKLGLVDDLGNFQDAVELARIMGHIEGKPKLIFYEEHRGLLARVLGEEAISWLHDFLSTGESPFQLKYP